MHYWKFLPPNSPFLTNGMLRLTQPAALNDPLEALPRVTFGTYSPEDYAYARQRAKEIGDDKMSVEDLESFFLRPMGERYDEKRFPGLYPAYETRLRPEPFETLAEFDESVARRALELVQRAANEHLGVTSFSRRESEPMWAHYAANHTGIAIRFKANHPFFSSRSQAIEYSDAPICISSSGGWVRIGGITIETEDILNSIVRELPLSLFLRKRSDWAYEQEKRIVEPLKNADAVGGTDAHGFQVYLIKVPAEAIDSIVFGYRADSAPKAVKSLRENPHWRHVRYFSRRRSPDGIEDVPLGT